MDDYIRTRETEPRNVVRASVRVDDKLIDIYSTHLAVSGDFSPFMLRHKEVDHLTTILRERVNDSRLPTILAGDFNASNDPYVLEKINMLLHNADKDMAEGTWPVFIESAQRHKEHSGAGFVEFEVGSQRLDHVFVSDSVEVRTFQVGETKASDHLPLIVDVAI
jgi:endonuclease/exonuclease/phosphatase family metal-dependent hydrolase